MRSVVRDVGGRARDRLAESAPGRRLAELRDAVREPKIVVPKRSILQLPLTLRGVATSGARIEDGRLVVDAELEDGRWLSIRLVPSALRFAPRGAKEVVFRVEPPELVGDPRARELVGRLAGLVAHMLFGAVIGRPREDSEAFVETAGDELAADLRTVPAVRQAGPTALALVDAIPVSRFAFEELGLALYVAMPPLR